MSTKIYNGFKLDTRVSTIFEFQQRFAQVASETVTIKQVQNVISKTITTFDKIIMGDRKLMNDVKNMRYTGNEHTKTRQGKHKLRNTPGWGRNQSKQLKRTLEYHLVEQRYLKDDENLSPEVVFFYGQKHDETVFIYYGDEDLKELVSKFPGVSDFAYWDNSDRPKHVSKKEWKHRRDVWNGLLSWGETPAEKGLRITPISKYALEVNFETVPETLKNHAAQVIIPTVKQRTEQVMNAKRYTVAAETIKAEGGTFNISRLLEEVGGLEVAPPSNLFSYEAKVRSKLPPLTLDDFIRLFD